MDLHEIFLASEIAGKNNGNGGSVDLSDYYTKSQTDGLLVNKIDKVNGMGLSENSFTDNEKTKLSGLYNYDDTQIRSQALTNRSTLGYQCKNLLKITAVSGTYNGISYTINNDGSVTMNGTAIALSYIFLVRFTFKAGVRYRLSGGINRETRMSLINSAGGELTNYTDNGDGVEISFDEDTEMRIRLRAGDTGNVLNSVTVFPMLKYAEITDDTYEPYRPSVEEYIANLEARITALEENRT